MSSVRQSAVPMWKKALQQPGKIGATLRMVGELGLSRTWSIVEARRHAAQPTGYSVAGVVVEVGKDILDLAPGDRVACAGALYANHAEFIRVPRNLCVLLPEDLDWTAASTVTLGAIALQGVRRAAPTLGETFVVVGLGILGQLTTQLLRAAGCRAIGIDLDRGRVDLALGLGMSLAVDPGEESVSEQVVRLTDGYGADGVIITAATPSSEVVSAAFKMCRKKARVILVGDVGLNLDRADFYAKEIDFLISSSYGPGRYDHGYEERGLDYPIAYVRWTENRNMGEYLRLLAEKRVSVAALDSAHFPIERAGEAYAALASPARAGETRPLMVFLDYPVDHEKPVRSVTLPVTRRSTPGRIRVALIGAGAFAQGAHLPLLRSLGEHFELHSVISRTGPSAVAAAKQFGARHAGTDVNTAFSDSEVDAVIISTRHHLHAELALTALRAGKHVLVEKPLALDDEQLRALDEFLLSRTSDAVPTLLTGFNRRFSPCARQLKKLVQSRSAPFICNYRMNAGYIPADHWVHGPEGGGRNIGEACHLYDLFTYLADARVTKVDAQSIHPKSGPYGSSDNFVSTLSFEDGSVASLTYTALGSRAHPKERAETFFDGKVAVLDDYRRLEVHGARNRGIGTPFQNKGLREELIAFALSIRSGEWAIPWWQQTQVARISFEVERALVSARTRSR